MVLEGFERMNSNCIGIVNIHRYVEAYLLHQIIGEDAIEMSSSWNREDIIFDCISNCLSKVKQLPLLF